MQIEYKVDKTSQGLYTKLNTQHRMHEQIFAWPREAIYKGNSSVQPNKANQFNSISPYTVLQVNTIEDIEIDFLKQLLEMCVQRASPKKFSYGIICGNSETRIQLNEMFK